MSLCRTNGMIDTADVHKPPSKRRRPKQTRQITQHQILRTHSERYRKRKMVFCMPEPGLPRMDFPDAKSAAKAFSVTPESIRRALRLGGTSGGRLWWYVHRPYSQRPNIPDVIRPHRKDRRVVYKGQVYHTIEIWAASVGCSMSNAFLSLQRGRFHGVAVDWYMGGGQSPNGDGEASESQPLASTESVV